jgi:hypothetical protein
MLQLYLYALKAESDLKICSNFAKQISVTFAIRTAILMKMPSYQCTRRHIPEDLNLHKYISASIT